MPKKEVKEKKEVKKKEARYISRYLELKLINKSSYTKEVGGKVMVVAGSSVQFHNGVFRTSDPNEIKFLDNHPNFGNVFIKIKDKDLQEARKKGFETLDERKDRKKAKEEEKIKKGKALEEGSALPKKKGKGKKSKKEKPAF